MEPIFQTIFTERIIFPDAPPPDIRRALLARGYKFNGTCWERNKGIINPMSHGELLRVIEYEKTQ